MKKYLLFLALTITVLTSAFASGDSPEQTAQKSNMIRLPDHLVDSDWLASNLDKDNLVILDTARSFDEFSFGHIDGALFTDRLDYWSEIDGIPGMFPGVEAVRSWLESLGISNDSSVVIYDSGPGLWAARVAWTLAYMGHDDWAVLDGGYAHWEAGDHPTINGDSPHVEAGNFKPELRPELLVKGDDIIEHLDDPNFVVVDTRSANEYSGEDVRGPRGGHIPGALPLEWKLNNTGSPARYLPTDQLAEFYATKDVESSDRVITMCQTGVRGAHTWLALTLAGYEDVALYDGSWSDWGANETYPVEK